MEPKKERFRRVRGAILKLLAHEHPKPIDCKVLHFLLDDLGYTIDDEECASHISYLEEKEYIKIEKRKGGGVRIKMITVCCKGLDLLDGFIKDPGVDVRF